MAYALSAFPTPIVPQVFAHQQVHASLAHQMQFVSIAAIFLRDYASNASQLQIVQLDNNVMGQELALNVSKTLTAQLLDRSALNLKEFAEKAAGLIKIAEEILSAIITHLLTLVLLILVSMMATALEVLALDNSAWFLTFLLTGCAQLTFTAQTRMSVIPHQEPA
jgi:hypothetical protein